MIEKSDIRHPEFGMRCETCKWWHSDVHDMVFPAWRPCHLLDVNERTIDSPMPMLVSGPEWSWIHTHADFGCVQWEPKE